MDIVTEKCKDCNGEGSHHDSKCNKCGALNFSFQYSKCNSCNGIGQVASITINGLTCKIILEIL